ncbi:hypothetical protein JTE90_020083 [Oedothorax gibbosus]|uniref:Uncharacterized protein n=1 Tax=Oedothorax gibbosus TaxID=931172 RepID=A0AAV6USM1_9ARAC|nr:hypothetical protein JTE90_020083 [Oedothorax gibbosus]
MAETTPNTSRRLSKLGVPCEPWTSVERGSGDGIPRVPCRSTPVNTHTQDRCIFSETCISFDARLTEDSFRHHMKGRDSGRQGDPPALGTEVK